MVGVLKVRRLRGYFESGPNSKRSGHFALLDLNILSRDDARRPGEEK